MKRARGNPGPVYVSESRVAIVREDNRVMITGNLLPDDLARLLSNLYTIVDTKGYPDIILDFSFCTKAFSSEMLFVCAKCLNYWKRGIDVELILPTDAVLARLFQNANWAYLIDFRNYDESRFRGFTHAPAIRFSDGAEQSAAVNKTLDVLLAAIPHFKRDDIRYIEWVVNEITDNVINHAQSPIGGIVQVTNHRQREEIQLVVADAGLTIPATLRPTHPELHTDSEALHAAIREGVTRDNSVGQGNGLYGTWSICQKTSGEFTIRSGYASLFSRPGQVLSEKNTVPINGTLLSARIGYSAKFDLSEALTFGGRTHIPVDYIDTHFQQDEHGNITFKLREECTGFGSRALGDPVRRKLLNLARMDNSARLIVDLEGVMLVSSSFADEVFGKLFLELGPVSFMGKIHLVNVDPLVRGLIDRAIFQRIGTDRPIA
jgi:anti-sigma regulatory factor (Ser/Thr protein kinase)